MASLHLSVRDQERLRAAQETLLSPFVSKNPHDWQLRANHALREFLGADHSVFFLPTRHDALPPVVTDDTDPSLPDHLRGFIDASKGPYYESPDPYFEHCIRTRVDGGPDAYHLDELLTPDQQEASGVIQDVFVPAGLPAMVGLSFPLPEGEATQFFGFEHRDAAGYTEEGLQKLRLLVPAFVAGVQAFRRWIGRRRNLISILDRLIQPLALYDGGGRRLHRNRALEELLDGEPRGERLETAMDELAGIFVDRVQGPRRAREEVPPRVGERVELGNTTYRLSATYGTGRDGEERSVLVQVRRSGARLPPPDALQERHGLTPRETEVALLLARGRSDKAIARRLDISWHTARSHVRGVLAKLGLSSRAQVAATLLGDGGGPRD